MFAPHYARPLEHSCIAVLESIRAAPSLNASSVSELLRGEAFSVVDASGGWAWGYSLHDSYVGYVRVNALGLPVATSHIVDAPAALIFTAADIKSPVVERLPMGARLTVTAEDGPFAYVGDGFVHSRHIRSTLDLASDPVSIAERLVGTPYRWGGRSGDGIDCSGLVQLAFGFAGIAAPRDSDQQATALGLPLAEDATLLRGDLVFFRGHVGIMVDHDHLLHANAHWMAVTTEPLGDVLARQPDGRGISAVRRVAQ